MEIIVFSLLPAFIYSFIVYLSTPYKAVKFSTGLSYLSIGFVSVIFVALFHTIFSSFSNPLFAPPVGLFFFAFIQIALVEELCKWSSFHLLTRIRKENDPPIAIMFYTMMSAAGFAVIENLDYAAKYGHEVIFYRTFSSVIIHMACGAFMGYMIARGTMKTSVKYKSVFEIFLKKYSRWRRAIYTFIGVAVATAVHGLYDYVIMLNPSRSDYKILIIVIGCLWLSFTLGKKLSVEHIVEED